MKTKLLFLLSFLSIIYYDTESQEYRTADSLMILSESAQQNLRRIPTLSLPNHYKGDKAPDLPPVLDNSQLPCFRPIFNQYTRPSCGQCASVGYAFTYEINRVRGLSSNSDLTQYPPDFAWNWENGGEGWYGVSYLHSLDVLKSVGTPNTLTYGGFLGPYGYFETYLGSGMFSTDEEYEGKYWMSGYDKYYQAMKNRISESYRIDLSTAEGIKILKYWLFDHLDGSKYGGVANFYACPADIGAKILPEGTPEAGKHITTYWGNPTHAMTICGYNDSICWDYNGDGLYTNDIDITGDGIVDVRDWEIGGFKFANSHGIYDGDEGFYYMSYKSCTDSILVNGMIKPGIWNSAANIMMVKENTEPLLTAKISIKHNGRGRLRVRMGCATDPAASKPEFIIQFPIFNFQGGTYKYMQGGESEADKTIEFGLDITPLLNMIPNDEETRFFLLVDENDPNNNYTGEIINFSIIDYTEGVNEILCSRSHLPIVNGTTSLWVNHTVHFPEVEILTDILKGAIPEQEYYYQIEADGGTEPYSFTIDKDYEENAGSQEFDYIDEYSYENDSIVQELEFEFPFYGENYHQVKVSKNGYLFFDRFIIDAYSHFYQLFQENKVIAPFLLSSKKDTIINAGIWYQGDTESAVFRWKSHIKDEPSSVLNFSVTLNKNGEIEFSYGENSFETTQWIAGLSSGKNKLYQFAENSSFASIPTNYHSIFSPVLGLDSLQLSLDGILSGMFKEDYVNKNIKVKVEDASNLITTKTLSFSPDPFSLLQLSDFLTRNPYDTSLLKYGDTVAISIKVENKGMLVQTNVKLKIRSSSPYIELQNNEMQIGDIDVGEAKEIDSAFTFVIAKKIPESLRFEINTVLETDEGETWKKQFYFWASSPKLKANFNGSVDDNDSILYPGETADVLFDISNIGIVSVQNISIIAHSIREEITFNTSEGIIDSLSIGETKQVHFNVSVEENIKKNSIFPINLSIEDKKGYHTTVNVIMAVGNVVEDFETGDLSQFQWNTSTQFSDNTWSVVSTNSYDGNNAVQMEYNEYGISELNLKESFLTSGNIDFSYYTNSPDLELFVHQEGLSPQICSGYGEWLTETYPVNKGRKEVEWFCFYDNSTEYAILDHISFPPVGAVNAILQLSPTRIQDTLFQSNYYENTIILKNLGRGNIYFSTLIVDSLNNVVDWVNVSPEYGRITMGENFPCKISLNAQDINMGNSKAILRIFDHNGNSFDIPLQFNLRYLERNACNDFEIASFPNPFKSRIRIDFKVKEEQSIEVQIFDLQGRMMKSEYLGMKKAGAHYFYWKGENSNGVQVPTGVYYLVISSNKSSCTQKLIKIK